MGVVRMGKSPAQLGREFERGVLLALNGEGVVAYKPLQHEAYSDIGDLHAGPMVFQCKQYRDVGAAIRLGVEGARVQATAAGKPFGAAVIRYRGHPIEESRVVMDLRDFARLLKRLETAERRTGGDA